MVKKDFEDLKDWLSDKFRVQNTKIENKIDELIVKYEDMLKETRETREIH